MLTLFEQIDKGTLWRSIGGIHPPERKTLSNKQPIKRLPLAHEFIVPLTQVGESSILAVKQGDYVAKGSILTTGTHFAHLPVHAPTSGHISVIEPRPSNHASGLDILSCVIVPDGLDTPCSDIHPSLSAEMQLALTDKQILTKIQHAGIAGLGGAAFPTHIKLNPASDIELVIINAIECEPYITSDDMLMREKSDEILNGIAIIHRLLKPKRLIIAIEDNKPEAIEMMQHALSRSALPQSGVRITRLPTQYPTGGEKQLIQILTGQEVPSGAIPAQLGILVQNVATAYAINDAVLHGNPLIERVVTITGENTQKPGNYWLPIGTPISHLLCETNFIGNENDKVIIGGPMMGYSLHNDNAPTLKGSNCILLPASTELAPPQPEKPCVRCGECAQVCPAQLLPQQLFWHAKAKEHDKAASYNLADCIECGCCTYVCPSDIPLVEYYRIAKSAIKTEAEEKKQAELAKQRFELRTQRLEDEKQAREAKQKEAAARRKSSMTATDKDAVALAMARIKAKKEAASASNVDGKSKEISAAVARAKAKRAAKETVEKSDTVAETPVNNTDSARSDKVAAAIARAKAKKAAANAIPEPETDTQSGVESATEALTGAQTASEAETAPALDDKRAKIAAAIARAKAKKAASNAKPDDEAVTAEFTASTSAETATEAEAKPVVDEKQIKIAAAIARAKAKKAAANAKSDAHETETADVAATTGPETATEAEATPAIDDKKARIAATIARAKAKKAAANAKPDDEIVTAEVTASTSAETATEAEATPAIDDKKARIAATVARAKAKKAAANAKPDTDETETADVAASTGSETATEAEATPALDDKKARIAATIAKAKAKKASSRSEAETITDAIEPTTATAITVPPSLDDKKAKIAAAVAKAKARKAAQASSETNENDKD